MGYTQTKYGNSVKLTAANSKSRLLDVDLAVVEPSELYKSGGWVLTLEAHNDLASALPPASASAGALANAGVQLVTATITIGAGGAAIPFQVTVELGTTVLLPSGMVSVDVEITLPQAVNMRVSGIIQRGDAQNRANLIQQVNITSAAVFQTGIIPNFATGLIVEATRDSVWYCNQLGFAVNSVEVMGPTLKDLFVKGIWLGVTQGARVWNILAKPSATEVTYGTFSANLVWRIEP